jgi:hypothetical protein
VCLDLRKIRLNGKSDDLQKYSIRSVGEKLSEMGDMISSISLFGHMEVILP